MWTSVSWGSGVTINVSILRIPAVKGKHEPPWKGHKTINTHTHTHEEISEHYDLTS